jgi:hypothetical protein
MTLKSLLVVAVMATALFASADSLQGDWRGTSLCQQKNTACHDEKVVYHISAPDSAGNVTIDADKIVDGKPDNMGTVVMQYDEAKHSLHANDAGRVWDFQISGRSMRGTLMHGDTLLRKIELTKD